MMDKIELGRIRGIPIIVDFSLLLIMLVWGHSYFTSGNLTSISYGLLLVAGVIGSILLHELGHAAAFRYYRIPVSHIELNGFGGLCAPAGIVPPNRWPQIVISLAGPAVTALLWAAFAGLQYVLLQVLDSSGFSAGVGRLYGLAGHLSYLNWWLLLFNLMPSHPLDGGKAVAHLLSGWLGYDRAMRLVACTGMLVVAWLVWMGISGSYFAFLIAFFLFMANQQVLQTHGGPRWKRWN